MKVAHILLALLPLALATPAPEAEFAVAVEEPVLAEETAFDLEKRKDDYAALKKDIKAISKENKKLHKELSGVGKKITGGQEVKIEKYSAALEKLVGKATKTCNASSKFSKSQSASGYKSLSKLEKATSKTIGTLIKKKKALAKTKSIVCSNLGKLKKGSASLGKCLAGKSTGPTAKKAKGLEKKFAADFKKGEKAYGC